MSEALKSRELWLKYCYRADGEPGCGIDVGSQGFCTVPWAMGVDLPKEEFDKYCGGHPPHGPIPVRSRAEALPFDSDSLDYLLSSHVLEDFPRERWPEILREWSRVLKPGGYLIVLVPERSLWRAAIMRGQPPNCSHAGPEPLVGDISQHAIAIGLQVVEEGLTNMFPGDYSILGVLRKP